MPENILLSPYLNIVRDLIPMTPYALKGSIGSATSFIALALHEEHRKNLLCIAKDESTASAWYSDLKSLAPKNTVLFFSGYKHLPQTQEQEEVTVIQERSEVLNALLQDQTTSLVVTYPEAMAVLVPPQNTFKGNTFEVRVGMALDLNFLQEWLYECGFTYQDPVVEPGCFCTRGGIIDVFSFSSEQPFRLEFNGNSIEQIRAFDPLTQLSIRRMAFMNIIPNVAPQSQEVYTSLLKYLKPESSILFLDGEERILNAMEAFRAKEIEAWKARIQTSVLKPPQDRMWSEDQAKIEWKLFWRMDAGLQNFESKTTTEILQIPLQPLPIFKNNFKQLTAFFIGLHQQGYTLIFCAQNPKQAERLQLILNDHVPEKTPVPEHWFTYWQATLHSGFINPEIKQAVFTDHQVFDRYHYVRRSQGATERKAGLTFNELTRLVPGDFVTHIDHGVGRFAGLHKLENQGKIQECMKLLYRDQDAVYVNIQNLHRVSKYTGKEGQLPQLDKLGSAAWQNLKQKTKRNVKLLAYDLIQLYAQRKNSQGFAFEPDSYLQLELESSFVFEDTPDQIKVMREIKSDMEQTVPMDRLLCGDVGFGKTEIAIRAAFKAVCSGKQVAVLVPTTILAYQHFKTFSERLKQWPCKIDYINRFRTKTQQHAVIQAMQAGSLDIIIGTHRLLGKEFAFKDLGLVIIDEEQKFGVASKDKLKLLKTHVDTLTLTATPIPRTLQFSLMGARDLSIISTPPSNRYPVQTEWHNNEDSIIQKAIAFELSRGGQVYVVNHRISDLENLARQVRSLVPGARVGIGHGQMEGNDLEAVMLDFMEGELDVLVSTTIVESGLDIRNANTMIIHNAQHYGLSDLHQMRGRVGRSNLKAFCYLLTPPGLSLSSDAQKRLQAIVEFSDLGSGFQIAMRDLDIRGAGNILGAEQSGFIQEMGFDTYMKLLQEAMEELHEETGWHEPNIDAGRKQFSRHLTRDVNFETDLSLYIPESYIGNSQERLNLYRELDQLKDESELEGFKERLKDRFGNLPEMVLDLFQLIRIRWMASELLIDKIQFKGNLFKMYFPGIKTESFYQGPAFEKILAFTQKFPYRCQLSEKNQRRWLEVKMVPDVHEACQIMKLILGESKASV